MAQSSKPPDNLLRRLSDPRIWITVASLAILLPLLVYAYMGIFSRYQADDYCYAWNGTSRTILNAQTTWYKTDSSRYAATFVMTLSDKLGRWTVPVLPAFVLGLWLAGTFWLFMRLQKMLNLAFPPMAAFLLAELLIYFVLMLAPNLYQILFWRAGLVIYLLPLVLLTFLGVFLLSQASNLVKKWRPLVAGLAILFFFFNGGFSETIATIQIGMLALALLVLFFLAKGETRKWVLLLVGCALLGALLALATLYFSPATRMRQGLIGPPPDLVNLVRMSLSNAFIFMYITLGDKAFSLVILLLIAMLTGYGLFSARQAPADINPTALVSTLFLMPVVTYLWVVCVAAPFAYGESTYPEGRVLLNAMLIMVAMIIVEGLILGVSLGLLHQRSPQMAPIGLRMILLLALVVVSLFPLYSIRKTVKDLPEYRQRAAAWDARDATIRASAAQGQQDVMVTAYTSVAGLMELGPESSMWVNGCAAHYYGVHSITAELP